MSFAGRLSRGFRPSRRRRQASGRRGSAQYEGASSAPANPAPRVTVKRKYFVVKQPTKPVEASSPPVPTVPSRQPATPARNARVFDDSVSSPHIVSLCVASRPVSRPLPGNVLPDILYESSDNFDQMSASSGFKSSSSISSNLTDATQVDDGLTDWGLPKVLFGSHEDVETDVSDTFSFGGPETLDGLDAPLDAPKAAPIEISAIGIGLSKERELPQQQLAQKLMSLMYTSLILKKAGKVPARFHNGPVAALREVENARAAIPESLAFVTSATQVWL